MLHTPESSTQAVRRIPAKRTPHAPPIAIDDGENVPPATTFQRALPQFLAVGVKNVLLFGYGMTLGFPTIVIPAIQGGEGRDMHSDIVLNRDEISWFSSINLLCVPLGCIFSGMFTQPIGKRRAMQLVNIPILAAWLLFHYATNIYHLYAGLCLAGLSGGLMEAPVLTYVAEVTDPKYRGMLSATGSTCVICGVFAQFLLGSMLKWRTIAAISMLFPVVSITALFFVPESPFWLTTKGRFAEAQQSLAWLRGWVPVSHVRDEYQLIYDALVKRSDEPKAVGCSATASRYGRRSFLLPYALIAFTFFVGHFSGKTTLQTYAVQIFHTLKAPIDKYYATVLLGAVEILGTLVCVVLVHYTGKRPLVLVSTVGCGLCFLGTATYAHYLDVVPGVVVENVVSNVSSVAETTFNDRQLLALSAQNRSAAETFDRLDQFYRQMVLDDAWLASNESLDELETDANETFADGFERLPVYGRNASDVSVVKLHEDRPIADILLRIPNSAENRFIWLPLTLLLMSAFFAHMGIKLIPWMLIGEVFPASVRSGASGISGGTGYMFGFLANKLFLSMLNTLTLPGTFWFYAAVALIGSAIMYFVLPETEGRTLMDIERHFNGVQALNADRPSIGGDVVRPAKDSTDMAVWEWIQQQQKLEREATNAVAVVDGDVKTIGHSASGPGEIRVEITRL